MKLALCQLGVSSDKQANLRLAGEAVKVPLCLLLLQAVSLEACTLAE